MDHTNYMFTLTARELVVVRELIAAREVQHLEAQFSANASRFTKQRAADFDAFPLMVMAGWFAVIMIYNFLHF